MFDFLKRDRRSDSKGEQKGISRAQFLRGDIGGKHRPLRPPWALDEYAFTETCSRCGECIKQCEQQILIEARGKFPVVEFKRGECTFCEACVNACEPGALRIESAEQRESPWGLEVQVNQDCVTHKGVVCQICGDQCLERVFRFRPRVGGAVQMEMSLEKCNGCGACIAPCPVSALSMQHRATAPANNESSPQHPDEV